MGADVKLERARHEAEKSPLAWLVTLELARSRNDFEAAANAIRQLREKGINVTYKQRSLAREITRAAV
jgi:hypothetical protein